MLPVLGHWTRLVSVLYVCLVLNRGEGETKGISPATSIEDLSYHLSCDVTYMCTYHLATYLPTCLPNRLSKPMHEEGLTRRVILLFPGECGSFLRLRTGQFWDINIVLLHFSFIGILGGHPRARVQSEAAQPYHAGGGETRRDDGPC